MVSDKQSPSDLSKKSEGASNGQNPETEITPELTSESGTMVASPSTVNPDIHRLIWVLLRGWWIILIVFIIAVVYSGYSLTTHSPVFTAHMVVREIDQGGGLAMPAQISGLAEGLGVQISEEESTVFDDFAVLLGMDRFAQVLDQKYGYVRKVHSGQWNEGSQSWNEPPGWRVELDDYFRGFAPIAEWTPPNTQQLARYIEGSIFLLEIQSNFSDSEAIRIQYQHPEADFALQFLSDIYQTGEEMLRDQELERISSRIAYVRDRLASITISEYRHSLIFVLAEQEKKLLSLHEGQPFVAEILQPPVVSDRPSSPNVLFRLILGGFVGLALGVVLVIVVAFFRSVLTHKPLVPKIQ